MKPVTIALATASGSALTANAASTHTIAVSVALLVAMPSYPVHLWSAGWL